MPVAAIFGSSLAAPTDRCCLLAADLARGLAERGFIVKNGGYGGVMGAASRAAREAGGEVVGVTVAGWRGPAREASPFLSREIASPDLFERLRTLIHGTDIFLAIEDGGPGTLNEVFLVWALIVSGEIPVRPLVLVGSSWIDLVEVLRARFRTGDVSKSGVIVAEDVAAALRVVDGMVFDSPAPSDSSLI